MSEAARYDEKFYLKQVDGSVDSAGVVVPILCSILNPTSVIDVGCGMGGWLRAFHQAGVETVHGVDGPWVNPHQLLIPRANFTQFDFGAAEAPFSPDLPQKRFDIAMTLEFVEHVDGSKADALVALLCSLSDVVVCGGAAPGQGGEHHVNEQWPQYWAALFAKHDYVALDFLRPMVWADPRVDWWYAQNTIVYFKGEPPSVALAAWREAIETAARRPLSLVHPGKVRKGEKKPRFRLFRR